MEVQEAITKPINNVCAMYTVVHKTCHFISAPASRCHQRAYVLPMLLFSMLPLSFDNSDRNAYCCVNTVDEKLLRLHM